MTIFSHIERVYEAIADHIPMTVFILSSVTLSFIVALHVQWDIALVMMVAAPIFVILRFIYSWVGHSTYLSPHREDNFSSSPSTCESNKSI
jgi:hypothetical protein